MDSLGSLSCCQEAQEKVPWLHVLGTPSVDGRTKTSFNSIQVKGDLCSVFKWNWKHTFWNSKVYALGRLRRCLLTKEAPTGEVRLNVSLLNLWRIPEAQTLLGSNKSQSNAEYEGKLFLHIFTEGNSLTT